MKSIYIYGASGHGLVVADIAMANGYEQIIFIDDGDNEYLSFNDIKENTNIPISLGIGSNRVRKVLFDKLKSYKFEIETLVHPSSIVSNSAKIGKGTVIMPNVVVNAKALVGDAVILNSSCVVEHECKIGNFSHISPNVALAGNVIVNDFTHIGIGSSIIQGVIIGKNCIIGAGSVVVKNINNNKKAFGNPCKVIEDINE
ncbi:acetyltransferase [Arcobacter sp. LA11]|uniref:acetyltransferase n=1 Tax=Arcobacter sp. LA11 TaxID=1898176 RepID=UPI00093454AF|nr:acetyltransferase [Arcobacter sp. LA11]